MTKQEARRIIRILRQGTVNAESARAISIGTQGVETHLNTVLNQFELHGSDGTVFFIEGDWGSGKSHLSMIFRGLLSARNVAWIHDSVDGRGNSLSHLNRRVSTWLTQIRIGDAIGLKQAIYNGRLKPSKVLEWAQCNSSNFSTGLISAFHGNEYGWLRALGYLCAMPDSSYQREKALAIVINAARMVRVTRGAGLVLMLDEVENICREWDVRGRKRAYDTLGTLAQCLEMKLILFVTRRFVDQALADYERAHQETTWTALSRRFLAIATTSDRFDIPSLTNETAHELIEKIRDIYSIAIDRRVFESKNELNKIHSAWVRTATKSTRLLVRLAINNFDLMDQEYPIEGRRRHLLEEENRRPVSVL